MKHSKTIYLFLIFALLSAFLFCQIANAQSNENSSEQSAKEKPGPRTWIILLSIIGLLFLAIFGYYIYKQEDHPTSASEFLANARDIHENSYSKYAQQPRHPSGTSAKDAETPARFEFEKTTPAKYAGEEPDPAIVIPKEDIGTGTNFQDQEENGDSTITIMRDTKVPDSDITPAINYSFEKNSDSAPEKAPEKPVSSTTHPETPPANQKTSVVPEKRERIPDAPVVTVIMPDYESLELCFPWLYGFSVNIDEIKSPRDIVWATRQEPDFVLMSPRITEAEVWTILKNLRKATRKKTKPPIVYTALTLTDEERRAASSDHIAIKQQGLFLRSDFESELSKFKTS